MKTRFRKSMRRMSSSEAELMLAPMVVMLRLPLMALEAQSATGPGAETVRAVNEKAAAAVEAMWAAQVSLVESAVRFWPELLSGRVPSSFSGAAAERAINAAMKPFGKTVGANYRRLSALK